MIHVLSLGAGVQSSTLALMAAQGAIGPMPDGAIFADTQAEPGAVYRQLDYLDSQLPFPIHRVTSGNLREEIYRAVRGEGRMGARPPFFVEGGGMLRRKCTQDYKLRPIQRKVRELIGLRPRQRGPKDPAATVWIGISTDEVQRMKPSLLPYVVHRWPLIEAGISRSQCLEWLRAHGHPTPPKSACTFCPYHDNRLWRDLQLQDPAAFQDAVAVDRAIRNGIGKDRSTGPLSRRQWFLHASRTPLESVDFRTPEEAGQASLFDDECEGMCGV